MAIKQLLKVSSFNPDNPVYIACSGNFKIEQALLQKYPSLKIHSNDVSIYSSVIGSLATGKPISFEFKDRLVFINDLVRGKPYSYAVAGVIFALTLSKFTGKSEFHKKSFDVLIESAPHHLEKINENLLKLLSAIPIAAYKACDFIQHIDEAIFSGATLFMYPPTYKSGYERMFKFCNENIEWNAPDYQIWDPKGLPDLVKKINGSGVDWFLLSDVMIDGAPVLARLKQFFKRDVLIFGKGSKSSLIKVSPKTEQFTFSVPTENDLVDNAKIRFAFLSTGQINFIRTVYLNKSIEFSMEGTKLAVMISDKLAGILMYKKPNVNDPSTVLLLSDTPTTNKYRLSKLISYLSLSPEALLFYERTNLMRAQKIKTIVYTKKPVSMKYRGIYEIESRREGVIVYAQNKSIKSAQEIYNEWRLKWFKP